MDSSIAPRRGSKRAHQGSGHNSATKHADDERITSGSGKAIRNRDNKSMGTGEPPLDGIYEAS
jgi:hypothetical protein